jgi:agmatinase
LNNNEANIITSRDIYQRGIKNTIEDVTKIFDGYNHIYLTLDIDVLDPAYGPGTGTPKAGGISTRDLLELLNIFPKLNIKAMDIVEYSPPLDYSDITGFAVQRIITEIIAKLSKSRNRR